VAFLLVGDRDGATIDVPSDPMFVVEAILELSLRMERVSEHAPNHLRAAVGRDWHHSLPDDAVDRGCLIEDRQDAAIGIVQTGKRFRSVRVPRLKVNAPSLFVGHVTRNERGRGQLEESLPAE